MSTAVSIGKGRTSGVFLRKATGLVREVSLIDALIMNTLGMNVAVGAVFLFLQAPANFPNGSMLVAVVIGTLLMAFTLLWVYSEFAAAMPRSGGDYVFVSRALHPFLGWLLSWSQGLWLIFFWIGFNAWFALTFAAPVALSTISVATGQDTWMNGANALISSFSFLGITTQWWVLIFGTLINVAFGALLLFGNRSYWRWQRWFFLFAGGSILIAALLLIFRGTDIPSAWNTFAAKAGGIPFEKVIPTAQSNGYTVPSGFDFGQTLLMLPWVFFVVGYAQGSAQIGGEVKRAARSQRIAMVGGVLINGAVLALLVILFTGALGQQWIGSLGYLANNAADKLGLPGTLTPGFNFIVSLLTQNVVILLIIGIGFVFWALLGTPLSELQATRYMLAWALDRTVPKRLGDVSERFHTPVNGIVLATVTGEIALIALVVNSQASLLGALLAQIAAFILVSIAGIVFPYRLKSTWESAGRGRIFGIPTVTLAGIGGVLLLGGFLYEVLFNSLGNATFAVTRPISLIFMIAAPIIRVVWYLAAHFAHPSRGLDLALADKELPPE